MHANKKYNGLTSKPSVAIRKLNSKCVSLNSNRRKRPVLRSPLKRPLKRKPRAKPNSNRRENK